MTTKRIKKASAAQLLRVAQSSFDSAKSIADTVAAVRAAGFDQQEVKFNWMAGRLMLDRKVNAFSQEGLDKALAFLNLKHHSKVNPAAEGTRTAAEQTIYVKHNVAWTRFLSNNDLESTGKNAGNKNAKGAKGKQIKGSGPAPKETAAGGTSEPAQKLIAGGTTPEPVKWDKLSANAHVQMQMAALLAFCNKHAKLIDPAVKQAVATAKLGVDKGINEGNGVGPNH